MKRSNKIGALSALAALAASFTLPAWAAPDTTRVIVAFQPGKAAQARAAVAAAHGAVVQEILNTEAVAIEVPSQALAGLQHNPNILYIEPDEKRYPLSLPLASPDPNHAGQLLPYGIHLVQADMLPANVTQTMRRVCIIDSGIDRSHEDFVGNTMTGNSDPNGAGNWYTDENHHGTHVAGTIAAVSNNTGVVGVNSNGAIQLHIVKVFGKDGWAYTSTLADAANKCGAANANVISMSLGGARASKTEENAFNALQAKGILSVAAAGNDGNRTQSYPAGYSAVVSVGALDVDSNWATFSQYNNKVELSAPGVGVLSTVPMNSGTASAVDVNSVTYASAPMEGSPTADVSWPLADFGDGSVVNAGAMYHKVCLIQRGTIDFATKVSNCQSSGGAAAIIYNNVAGSFSGTLGTTVTAIPSVSMSMEDGTALKNGALGTLAHVVVQPSSYAYYDGTSMATPHVSGVAALVWSYFPACSGSQIRTSLDKSAKDLGPAGRDVKYGYGLVQFRAAYDRIAQYGCGK